MERSPTFAIHVNPGQHHTFSTSDTPYAFAVPISRAKRRAMERELKRINIYDVGVYKNLSSVLGAHWWEWGLPIGRT